MELGDQEILVISIINKEYQMFYFFWGPLINYYLKLHSQITKYSSNFRFY